MLKNELITSFWFALIIISFAWTVPVAPLVLEWLFENFGFLLTWMGTFVFALILATAIVLTIMDKIF